jgi:hypothetical protein
MAILKESLSDLERRKVEAARRKAFILYEGKLTPHRSCGIALAETFNLPTRPYQSLRRGGITGEGECGAIKAGELILGEILGDPDPTGPPTPVLREAARRYREEWTRRVDRGPAGGAARAAGTGGGVPAAAGGGGGTVPAQLDIICNHLTTPFGDFQGPARQRFCTSIAAEVAEIVAEILLRAGVDFEVKPIPGLPPGTSPGPAGSPGTAGRGAPSSG